MFEHTKAFSGFSVDDIPGARQFYGETLGLDGDRGSTGMLTLHIAGDRDTLVYPKQNHVPATYTILNFPVGDIESAVDELAARGVVFERYDGVDARGIIRARARRSPGSRTRPATSSRSSRPTDPRYGRPAGTVGPGG